MSNWVRKREEARRSGSFETKMYAPALERKPGVPYANHKPALPPASAQKIAGRVERAEKAAAGSGQLASPEKIQALRERIERIQRLLRRVRGKPQTNAPRPSQPATARQDGRQRSGIDLPEFEFTCFTETPAKDADDQDAVPFKTWFAARRMKRLACELLDLPGYKWPVRWRQDMAEAGSCTADAIELNAALSPKQAARVVSHECMHASQFQRGLLSPYKGRNTGKERRLAEEDAEAFSRRAMAEYRRRYGGFE